MYWAKLSAPRHMYIVYLKLFNTTSGIVLKIDGQGCQSSGWQFGDCVVQSGIKIIRVISSSNPLQDCYLVACSLASPADVLRGSSRNHSSRTPKDVCGGGYLQSDIMAGCHSEETIVTRQRTFSLVSYWLFS